MPALRSVILPDHFKLASYRTSIKETLLHSDWRTTMLRFYIFFLMEQLKWNKMEQSSFRVHKLMMYQ